MALGSTNRYLSTVNIVMGSNIGKADRTLALESANRLMRWYGTLLIPRLAVATVVWR
ncbi:hypothetical protein [Vreelandella alkaliphila]|uniref:hypothetical protein n=1 Tax=Vreelandella alkaliphila TaxID=272774 RepID=UPI00142D84A9|nr:hypothetical protein [Halomonas alkaliphila]